MNLRDASDADAGIGIVLQVTGAKLIQDRWAERMDKAERACGEVTALWVREATRGRNVRGTEFVGFTKVVVIDVKRLFAFQL